MRLRHGDECPHCYRRINERRRDAWRCLNGTCTRSDQFLRNRLVAREFGHELHGCAVIVLAVLALLIFLAHTH